MNGLNALPMNTLDHMLMLACLLDNGNEKIGIDDNNTNIRSAKIDETQKQTENSEPKQGERTTNADRDLSLILEVSHSLGKRVGVTRGEKLGNSRE